MGYPEIRWFIIILQFQTNPHITLLRISFCIAIPICTYYYLMLSDYLNKSTMFSGWIVRQIRIFCWWYGYHRQLRLALLHVLFAISPGKACLSTNIGLENWKPRSSECDLQYQIIIGGLAWQGDGWTLDRVDNWLPTSWWHHHERIFTKCAKCHLPWHLECECTIGTKCNLLDVQSDLNNNICPLVIQHSYGNCLFLYIYL